MNTQTKFTNMLRALAEKHGLELVDDRKWANTGTFRLEAPDSFVPVVSMDYSFQNDYASFDNVRPAHLGDRDLMLRDWAGGPVTKHGTHFPYVLPEELDKRVLSRVRAVLAARLLARTG